MSLLGLDLGSSACKAAVFTEGGACLAQATREYPTRQDYPGQAKLSCAPTA